MIGHLERICSKRSHLFVAKSTYFLLRPFPVVDYGVDVMTGLYQGIRANHQELVTFLTLMLLALGISYSRGHHIDTTTHLSNAKPLTC